VAEDERRPDQVSALVRLAHPVLREPDPRDEVQPPRSSFLSGPAAERSCCSRELENRTDHLNVEEGALKPVRLTESIDEQDKFEAAVA
jgi:hypothetical protein